MTTLNQQQQASQDARQATSLKIGGVLGIPLALLVAGIGVRSYLGDSSIPSVVSVAMLLGGVMSLCLHIFALKGSRAAWSFAIAFDGTCAVLFFFGAPTIDDSIQIGFAVAVIPAILFMLAAIFLAGGPPAAED